jgi:hypothetical protein
MYVQYTYLLAVMLLDCEVTIFEIALLHSSLGFNANTTFSSMYKNTSMYST